MKKLMITALVTVSAAAVVQAAIINQAAVGGWNEGATWVGGAIPTVVNDYVMDDRVNTLSTTTPNPFLGKTLTLSGSSANLQVYANEGLADAVTANLILNGGKIALNQATGASNYGLILGTMEVQATTRLATYQNATQQRNMQVGSLISGSATLLMVGSGGYTGAGNQYVQIKNAANTFSGKWQAARVRAIFDSASATGTGNFDVDDEGYVRINDDWSGEMDVITGAEVEAGSGNTYTFDQDDLTVNGSAFNTLGNYTAAQLNTATGTSIFSGAGTFEVIPEPATLGLIAVFGGAIMFIRRRFVM